LGRRGVCGKSAKVLEPETTGNLIKEMRGAEDCCQSKVGGDQKRIEKG